jgi:site-specific DNA recombinase
MATRIIGYVRVSTDKQVNEGHSLEGQRTKLEAYAVVMGLDLVGIETDAGQSAKSLDRDGLRRALEALDAGRAEGLLVTKLDRLTRSVKDLGDLVERYFSGRFSLLSVGDSIDTRTPGGRLVLNVLASVAQWERETIRERVREGMATAKGKGQRFGPSPLSGPVVDRMRTLRSEGATLVEISRTLTAEGHATLRGGKWAPETVRKVLSR